MNSSNHSYVVDVGKGQQINLEIASSATAS